MKKIPLVILGSARKQTDARKNLDAIFTETRCNYLDLLDHNISNYDYNHQYPHDDEFLKVVDEMLKHDVIIFVTPVYWYAMSGLMKVFFDRLTDLVTVQKELGRKLKGKSTFLLATGAETEMPKGFETPFKRTSEYFDMVYHDSIYFCTRSPQAEHDLGLLADAFKNKMKQQYA